MPASEAIASDIGHGAPGLRDNLRPFTELLEETAGQRHLWVEARGKVLVTGWVSHDTDGTSVIPFSQIFDGARRDVVGVRTRHENLRRAEAITDVEATPGTFYYDPSAERVSADVIVDEYTDYSGNPGLDDITTAVGQSFLGDGSTISGVEFWIGKSGSPTGNAYAKLYAHSGVFGTDSVPSGPALAISGPLDVSTLGLLEWHLFTFPTPFTTANGTHYVIVLEYTEGTAVAEVWFRSDDSSPTHPGNQCNYTTVWNGYAGLDLCFKLKASSPERWDDGLTLWDGSVTWDEDALLYVHLSSGRNPAELDVVVELGFFFGSHGVWQPTLGADKLTDGILEDWATASDLTYWSETTTGGASIAQSADAAQGEYSAKLTASGGDLARLHQAGLSAVVGRIYRLSGAYKTDNTSGSPSFGVEVYGATKALYDDGRTTGAVGTAQVALAETRGEWRRFCFDFIAPEPSLTVRAFLTGTGEYFVDDLALQPIHRFEYYEPRLGLEDLPRVETARADAFFGPISTSLGSLSLLNGDGYMEQLFGAYDWLGATFVIRVGGRFAAGGNEILADDLHTIAQARASEPKVTDARAIVRLEDLRAWFDGYVPRRFYGGVEADTPRPLMLGFFIDNITPAKVDEIPEGYGVYEVADCDDWPPGIHESGGALTKVFVRAYIDEGAAARQEASGVGYYLCQLTPLGGGGPDYGVDLATGRVTILRDVQAFIYTYENSFADFNIGGGALVASLTANIGVCEKLVIAAIRLQSAMRTAAGVSDIYVSYDETTHKFTVRKDAGTLQLLTSSGANRANSFWTHLGFDTSGDKTGALSYEGDQAVFQSAEKNHIIRMGAAGYADDADGTYTGTGGDYIKAAPDMVHFLLREIVGIPAERIDVASFVAARTTAATFDADAGLFMGAGQQVVRIADLIEQLETAFSFELVQRAGIFYWQDRDDSVPSDVVTLENRDYLAFEAGFEAADYASSIQVGWNQDPTSGRWRVLEASDETAALRFGRPGERAFWTALNFGGPDLASRRAALLAEVTTKRRRFRVDVKGKTLTLSVGDKLQLTRSKGLDTTGALDEVLVRIIAKRDDWAGWVSELTVIEVV